MSRIRRIALLGAAAAILWPVAAWAQYPSELVGFNGPPIDDPVTSQEMFRPPQVSGSTDQYIILNPTDPGDPNYPYGNNAAFRASGLQTEGAAAMRVYFKWINPADPQGWLRLTTWNGPERPNPALHTQGKVRFKLINQSEYFQGEIGICLGIRETGQLVPQMADGGSSGDIEWVGVTGVGPDPNNPVPIPAVTLPVTDDPRVPYELEWDLTTGIVRLDGVSQGGGIAGFTGDGVLNAPNNRGTLEHIALTNVPSDAAIRIEVAIDELQFEAPEPDPVLPPTVVWPIIAGDLEVTVTDLQIGVDQVNLLLDGAPYVSEDVTTPDDVIFTLPAPAETGQAYSATQRVNGVLSEESAPVIVLPEPPPYTFSLLVDEGGTGSCDYTTGGWEWVGVIEVEGWAPVGQPLFTNDGLWQTIDVPLDDDSLVLPSFGGDGALGPSPNGVYTIDSIWFTLAEPNAVGPWEVLVDAVQYLDEFGQVGGTLLDMEDGVNRLQYARGQSPDELGLISSGHTQVSSYDGRTAHRLVWEYDGTPPESIGMLQRIGYTCGTSALIPDTATAVRFHLLLRGQPTTPDIPLPEVVGPIIVGTQDTVRILNDEAATSVQLYLNGEPAGDPATPTGDYTDFGPLTLTPGDSVSATQTLPAGESDLAYPRTVSASPPPPTVVSPIFPGDTTVTVTDLLVVPYATAEYVVVYADGEWVGFNYGGTETVTVTITEGGPLEEGQLVTATQYVNGVESDFSEPVVVGIPGPTLYMAPAEGADVVRVLGVHPDASLLTVWVNGGASSFEVDPAGNTTVDVPVSGLVMGDVVTAWMTVDGNPSGESDPETVTTNATTTIVCDNFEYEQADYEAAWADTGYPRLELVDTKNATFGGQKSLYAPLGDSRVDARIAPLIPTETEPVVINFDIYDEVGVGNEAVQFVQLTGDLDVGDYFLMEVGILGWSNTDNVHYDFRAIGNGGPNWVDLDQFDGPDRSVGWHNITVVHKGNRFDVYVDKLLALKNLELSDETTYEFARIGAAPYSTGTAYFDDYCIEVGPVRFGWVPPPPIPGDVDGDGDVDLTDLAALLSAYGSHTGDPNYNPNADFDQDGDVDLNDLATLLSHYGEGT